MANKTSSSYLTSLAILVIVVTSVALAAYIYKTRKNRSRANIEKVEITATAVAETDLIKNDVVESQVETVKSETEIVLETEDPNSAFPSMLADVGDADAELASAFTYENLQDSMLTSGKEAREAVKSRAAWSRFGDRGNAEVWEEQMIAMKKEIQASGQTIEQFMESSWAPIPEQMAAYWKDSMASDQIAEVKSVKKSSRPSRAALSEAPSLTQDVTQTISTTDATVALQRMNEIIDARKRAKSLKLSLPEFSSEQKKDLDFWSVSEDKAISGAAKVLLSL